MHGGGRAVVPSTRVETRFGDCSVTAKRNGRGHDAKHSMVSWVGLWNRKRMLGKNGT
jgi:hypothetical protein